MENGKTIASLTKRKVVVEDTNFGKEKEYFKRWVGYIYIYSFTWLYYKEVLCVYVLRGFVTLKFFLKLNEMHEILSVVYRH